MNSQPQYFSYFTQATDPFFEFSLDNQNLDWIDLMNKQRKSEKQQRIDNDTKNGFNPDNTFDTSEEQLSKDFDSIDFPSGHIWPIDFMKKYKTAIKSAESKMSEIVKTAKKVLEIDDVTIYLECEDNNHYFSTRYYACGSIERAKTASDSSFDSVDTAIYAFINDYKDWQLAHGKTYEKTILLSNLEALRQPDFTNTDCQHDDLGSLGYQHGSIVECPFCFKNCEVW